MVFLLKDNQTCSEFTGMFTTYLLIPLCLPLGIASSLLKGSLSERSLALSEVNSLSNFWSIRDF